MLTSPLSIDLNVFPPFLCFIVQFIWCKPHFFIITNLPKIKILFQIKKSVNKIQFAFFFFSPHYSIPKCYNYSILSSSFYSNSSSPYFIYYKIAIFFFNFLSIYILPTQKKVKTPSLFCLFNFIDFNSLFHLCFRLMNFCVEFYFGLMRFGCVLICYLFYFLIFSW